MQKITCPHCGHEGAIETKVPKEVLVVLPCPACHDLVVMFRRKVIGIRREVLENGTFEERKAHIAEVVAQFLDPEVLPELMSGLANMAQRYELEESGEEEHITDEHDGGESPNAPEPISQKEFEQFIEFELKMIDDRAYFRKHFS